MKIKAPAIKAKVRVVRNIWGNYCGYVGRDKVIDFGQEYDATEWLSEKLSYVGYTLSAASEITMHDIEVHRARLANTACRIR